MKIRLGSRVSPLAMAQTRLVQAMLIAATGESADGVPIEGFTTTGDRIQDRRLLEAGGKGLFTKELDEALLGGRIDAAIHSMKDLPTRLPPGIVLACVPAREDPRDAFLCASAGSLMDLPIGAVVGTASLRRQAQVLNRRPDLRVVTLRGSVETRLRKLAAGEIDATFLALAGLTRLGFADKVAAIVPVDEMLPAAGQGALAVTCRSEDREILAVFASLTLFEYDVATTAERAFLDALDGSCRTPIGALARVAGDTLSFLGEVLTADGSKRWKRSTTITLGPDSHAAADQAGRALGEAIRMQAGKDFPTDVDSA